MFDRRSAITLLIAGLALAILIPLLNTRFGSVPAFGPLLDPISGVWVRPKPVFESQNQNLNLDGLKAPVRIVVDQDQIKHIFAENDHDLYFAQGYVVASDRLWMMEFITRLAGGRLSEILGEKAFEYDKYFHRMGVPEAAKLSAEGMLSDSTTGPAIEAYVAGVNAYISSLTPETDPFEFRLLGTRPEAWDAVKGALLMKFMAYNLAANAKDIPLTRSKSRVNPEDFQELFPVDLAIPEPIIPAGTAWNFPSRNPVEPEDQFEAEIAKLEPLPDGPHPSNGSNNWAVSGKRSTTGKPILSNDIHLGLSLPGLFYEMQLVSPTQNVYGSTLPGAPGIILGFNADVAWGVTNGATDVLDWYQLKFHDVRRSEYFFDGKWRPVISREVPVRVRDEIEPRILTLRSTHLGPIVYEETETAIGPNIPRGLAMRWAALDPSNELRTFMQINRAKRIKDCRQAIENYQAPDQNFLCADRSGDIALWHMGRYPARWSGQGRTVSDGSSSKWEWQGWIPREEVPQSQNPSRGFLSSANQRPTDSSYPHYLGTAWDNPFRGIRINEILRSKDKHSPEDLMAMQADTLAVTAREALPKLLEAIKAKDQNERTREAVEILRRWDYRFEEESAGAAIYHAWQKAIEKKLWLPYFPNTNEHVFPSFFVTLRLITSGEESKWFDDPTTVDVRETLSDVAWVSLQEGLDEVILATDEDDPSDWTWAQYRPTKAPHLGRIPGLGNDGFPARGMEHTVFANHGTHGAVWKQVVALGDEPKAWGLIFGGPSGDPRSPHYDSFVDKWRGGIMRELYYMKTPSSPNPRKFAELIFQPTPSTTPARADEKSMAHAETK